MKLHRAKIPAICGLCLSFILAQAILSRADGKTETTATVAGNSAGKPVAELAPLPPEIAAMALSNNTASVTEQIAGIEKTDLNPAQKAQALLLALPALNKDGQRRIAHAMVKHVDDQNYLLIRLPLLQGKLNNQVLSIFLTDTLKRQNRIKIPLLLDLARADNHPMRTEARELLIAYSRQDHGTNWGKWELAMNTWLAKNSD